MATDKVDVGGPGKLTFGDLRREPSGEITGVTVTVDMESLRARREVYLYGFTDLTGFFAGLAENWRGWNGTRNYESIEHDLLLEATHTGSTVELLFTLQDPSFPDARCVRGKLTLGAGEELTRVSEDIKDLFSPPRAQDT